MSKDYDKAIDELMKDMQDLRADMKGVASALRGEAGSCVDNARESLAATLTNRPFACLLATLGAGVLLGGLLRGGRR